MNVSAESNARALKPADLSKPSNATRTAASSSTIATTLLFPLMAMAGIVARREQPRNYTLV
jgi:hypothetical protein